MCFNKRGTHTMLFVIVGTHTTDSHGGPQNYVVHPRLLHHLHIIPHAILFEGLCKAIPTHATSMDGSLYSIRESVCLACCTDNIGNSTLEFPQTFTRTLSLLISQTISRLMINICYLVLHAQLSHPNCTKNCSLDTLAGVKRSLKKIIYKVYILYEV